jgi:methionine-rich copper-binding protein CopC
MRTVLGLAFGLALTFVGTEVAQAHAKLLSANPPINGAVNVSLHQLDLKFSEAISGALSGVDVKGDHGSPVAAQTMLDSQGKGLMVMFRQPLPVGVYTVDWHAVATDDGHRTVGTYKFTVK